MGADAPAYLVYLQDLQRALQDQGSLATILEDGVRGIRQSWKSKTRGGE